MRHAATERQTALKLADTGLLGLGASPRPASARDAALDTICKEIDHGLVTPSAILSVQGEYWHDADLAESVTYDPGKAEFHLRAAGMPLFGGTTCAAVVAGRHRRCLPPA